MQVDVRNVENVEDMVGRVVEVGRILVVSSQLIGLYWSADEDPALGVRPHRRPGLQLRRCLVVVCREDTNEALQAHAADQP